VYWPFHVPGVTREISALDAHDALEPGLFEGDFAVTQLITMNNTQRKLQGLIHAPEHIALHPGTAHCPGRNPSAGKQHCFWWLYLSSSNGTMYQAAIHPDGNLDDGSLKEVVYAGPGPILGFDFAEDGSLYICNALQVRNYDCYSGTGWRAGICRSKISSACAR
jgi:hypothetical protein